MALAEEDPGDDTRAAEEDRDWLAQEGTEADVDSTEGEWQPFLDDQV